MPEGVTPSASGDQRVARPKLVLASASPRRRALLEQIGWKPDAIIAAMVDETPGSDERPNALAVRLARSKALHVAATEAAGTLVLGGDTVVAAGRRVLPQAADADEVARCLRLLSGRRHRVHTAIALAVAESASPPRVRLVTTMVRFRTISAAELTVYAASGEGIGKAGGYAIQGRAAVFVAHLAGSYSAVVGLPLMEVDAMLRHGAKLPTR